MMFETAYIQIQQLIDKESSNQFLASTGHPKNRAPLSKESELVDILIKYGNNVEGFPALHYAIRMADLRSVGLLLKHGADPNAQIYRAYLKSALPVTALDFAAVYGTPEIIDILIDNGANICACSFDSPEPISALYFAIKHDRPDTANRLLDHGASLNQLDFCGWANGVETAISYGSINVLHALKDRGIDFTDASIHHGSMLCSAAYSDRPAVLKFLLNEGIDPNTSDWRGTPLHAAISSISQECVQLLIAYGANIHASNDRKDTPIQSILSFTPDLRSEKVAGIILDLIEAGADLNAKGSNEGTPFFRLIQHLIEIPTTSSEKQHKVNSYLKRTEYLLLQGSDVNAVDRGGKPLLQQAREKSNQGMINWLIIHGAR